MVILWTQHEGGSSQDPSSHLLKDTEEEEEGETSQKALPDILNHSPIEHPKVSGLPPSGKKQKSLSPPSPRRLPHRRSRSMPRSSPPKDKASEKCIVTIKDQIYKKQTPTSSPTESPENSFTGVSPPGGKSLKLVDSCKVKNIRNETPTRVFFKRNGTPKSAPKENTKVLPATPNFEEGDTDDEVDNLASDNQQPRLKRFYTLPRNWRSRASGFFRNKGKEILR